MSSSDPNTSGNTQYNLIADAYSRLYPPDGETCTSFPLSILESHQLYVALVEDATVDIRGKHVLDFACGCGHHSSKFLRWGAASITGVDISSSMLDAARASARSRGIGEDRLRYVLGDATDTDLLISTPSTSDGRFDIATGCWLLDYSPDTDTMTKMWKVIGRHLKPGGVFVGLVNPPLLTGKPFEGELLDAVMTESGAWGKYGQRGRCLETMPNDDGFKVKIELGSPEQCDNVAAFDCYYLCNRVYEDGCEGSGLFDGLEWRDFSVPVSERQRKQRSIGFWNNLALYPHCRICVARRI